MWVFIYVLSCMWVHVCKSWAIGQTYCCLTCVLLHVLYIGMLTFALFRTAAIIMLTTWSLVSLMAIKTWENSHPTNQRLVLISQIYFHKKWACTCKQIIVQPIKIPSK